MTQVKPAIYQSYPQDGRNRPPYAAHVHEHIKTHSKQQLVRRWTFDLDVEPTHRQSGSCRARSVNIDDGPEYIMWIRDLGGGRLPTASYALHPNLNNLFFRLSTEKRDRKYLSSFFYTPADDRPSISI